MSYLTTSSSTSDAALSPPRTANSRSKEEVSSMSLPATPAPSPSSHAHGGCACAGCRATAPPPMRSATLAVSGAGAALLSSPAACRWRAPEGLKQPSASRHSSSTPPGDEAAGGPDLPASLAGGAVGGNSGGDDAHVSKVRRTGGHGGLERSEGKEAGEWAFLIWERRRHCLNGNLQEEVGFVEQTPGIVITGQEAEHKEIPDKDGMVDCNPGTRHNGARAAIEQREQQFRWRRGGAGVSLTVFRISVTEILLEVLAAERALRVRSSSLLHESPISWQSAKQKVAVFSSWEAEYIAATTVAYHAVWAKQMLLLEEMRTMMQKQNEKMESMFRENHDLREKVSCLMADISRLDGYLQKSSASGILSDQQCSTPLQLKFLNSCKNDKYSKHKIEADDKTPLKVAIFNHKNEIITSEPFSSMRVHVVPIHGDFDHDHKGQWTEKHFCSKIVSGRPGKEHLLSGDLYIRLQNGVGYLNAAKFQDNSSFVASKRFKLGVMAADERISQRIQEGISDSFAVKDVRGYCKLLLFLF
ncbi:hypothetical protein U9M48_035170 [Paspalum notatum var. saurae]|uniref:Calmodulin binding protein-like N-terminal domain-containing protein n=1 Tax=Paspalum notatum var. saurae TaxID=547442 RepID=A0AAQ3X7G2_PASNO